MAIIPITTLAELQSLALLSDWSSNTYLVANDIDMSDTDDPDYGTGNINDPISLDVGNTQGVNNEGWLPIGNTTNAFNSPLFDGQGFTLSGLCLNRPSSVRQSFIGAIAANDSVLRRFNLTGVLVSAGNNSGIFANGLFSSTLTIKDVHVTGTGTSTGHGMAAILGGDPDEDILVEDCTFDGTIVSERGRNGGIAGQPKQGTYRNCKSNGTISNNNNSLATDGTGGIIGRTRGLLRVENCSSSMTVIGSFTDNSSGTGGIVGQAENDAGGLTMVDCNFTGSVSNMSLATTNTFCGGLVGKSIGSDFNRCKSNGDIIGSKDYVGGLIGSLDAASSIKNSYATGNVTGEDKVGGAIGDSNGEVENCYSTGLVTGSGSDVGGFCGADTGNITNCFYDSETSGQSDTGKGEPKTTSEMQQQSTFTDWDFQDTWFMARWNRRSNGRYNDTAISRYNKVLYPRLRGVDKYGGR